MKIKKILSQHRRDFYATYECEGCGHVTPKMSGYDDTHFHQNVIPKMRCDECGKSSADFGDDAARPLAPKYPDSATI